MTFVVAHLLRFILRAASVNTEVLCASIAAYLMLGFMWTVAYWSNPFSTIENIPNAHRGSLAASAKTETKKIRIYSGRCNTLSTLVNEIAPPGAQMLNTTEQPHPVTAKA